MARNPGQARKQKNWSLAQELVRRRGQLSTTYWICAFAVNQHDARTGAVSFSCRRRIAKLPLLTFLILKLTAREPHFNPAPLIYWMMLRPPGRNCWSTFKDLSARDTPRHVYVYIHIYTHFSACILGGDWDIKHVRDVDVQRASFTCTA